MPDFSEFIVNHWMLWSFLVVLIGVFASMELIDKFMGLRQLKPQEVVDWVNHHDAIVVDIRPDFLFQHDKSPQSTVLA